MIRLATVDDIASVLVLLEKFWRDTGTQVYGTFDGPGAAAIVAKLIELDEGAIFLSESGQSGAGFFVSPSLWSPSRLHAQEVFWWVHPEERGGGLGKTLRVAGEDWAREYGANAMTMVALANERQSKMHSIYSKAGYQKTETHYVKGLS